MNILIQTLYPAPYRVALFELLAAKHNIIVFFEKDNDNRNPLYCNYSDKFTYYVLGSKKADRAYADALRQIKQYDFVMLYEYSTRLSGKLIFRCIAKHVRYAINCDGAVDISKKFPKKLIKTFFIKHASLCLAGGEKAKEYFTVYGSEEDKIFIHNFTAIYEKDIIVPPTSAEKKKMRENFGIKGETVTVSVGQFIPRKRFDLLINTWKNVSQEHCLYIIGSGYLKEELQKLIEDNHLSNVFLVDFLKRDKLFEFYSFSDLFVFSTAEDIWGLVINEAFACGLPVISTEKCTAAKEMIKENDNGYLIAEDEPTRMEAVFSQRISELLNDSQKRSLFADNAAKRASEYTYENMCSVVLRGLETIELKRDKAASTIK